MTPDTEAPETAEAVALPGDFAERVLWEVEHRRSRARRLRAGGLGLALVATVAVAGRVPGRLVRQLVRHPRMAPALVGAAGGDSDDLLGGEAALDPDVLLVAGIEGAQQPPDPDDDPDSELLGQE